MRSKLSDPDQAPASALRPAFVFLLGLRRPFSAVFMRRMSVFTLVVLRETKRLKAPRPRPRRSQEIPRRSGVGRGDPIALPFPYGDITPPLLRRSILNNSAKAAAPAPSNLWVMDLIWSVCINLLHHEDLPFRLLRLRSRFWRGDGPDSPSHHAKAYRPASAQRSRCPDR